MDYVGYGMDGRWGFEGVNTSFRPALTKVLLSVFLWKERTGQPCPEIRLRGWPTRGRHPSSARATLSLVSNTPELTSCVYGSHKLDAHNSHCTLYPAWLGKRGQRGPTKGEKRCSDTERYLRVT